MSFQVSKEELTTSYECGSSPEAILAAVRDRLRAEQGVAWCHENDFAIEYLTFAISALERRQKQVRHAPSRAD